ncbi:MAG: alanine racemase [Acidimicrobiales bacterium]
MSAVATIDRGAVRRNVERLVGRASGAVVCAVVKADGYGHGASAVAGAALDGGASWLAVATPAEAAELDRALTLHTPVLLLSEPDPDTLRMSLADLPGGPVHDHLRSGGRNPRGARGFGCRFPPARAREGGHRHAPHGCRSGRPSAVVEAVRGAPGLRLEGLWTHFAVADDPADGFTAEQTARFDRALAELDPGVTRGCLQHLSNSAGILGHPDAHRDVVQAGIAMYGVAPSPALASTIELEPALRLTATVRAAHRDAG